MAEVLAILKAIQSGNENAFAELLSQYQPLIQKMAQSFLNVCPELDREDLIQEASLALSNAAKHYRLDETGVTFGLYAKICIKNRLISIV
ncbi:MAG: helix-turn-helix domain-containing protein [Clostridia bacterium]|nr:helix-turn-helix domain-containing protein [Clostridia bacterium]